MTDLAHGRRVAEITPLHREVLTLLNPRFRRELEPMLLSGARPDEWLAEAIAIELDFLATHMPSGYQPTGRPVGQALDEWLAWMRR